MAPGRVPSMLRSVAAVGLALLVATLAPPTRAQTEAARLSHIVSRDFAHQSTRALHQGRRAEAILLALRGLPADPAEADFDTFAEAHAALFHAVASRSVRVARDGYQYYGVNSTGTRAVVGDFEMSQNRILRPEPFALIDANSGQVVAELLAFDALYDTTAQAGVAPPFSPDGRLLSLASFQTGDVHLFDAATGQLLRVLTDPGIDYTSQTLGFSPDGAFYATAGDVVTVWNVVSGAVAARLGGESARNENLFPFGWTHDNRILFLHSSDLDRETYDYRTILLETHGLDGSIGTRIDLSQILRHSPTEITVSPWGPQAILGLETRFLGLDLTSGGLIFDITGSSLDAAAFIRDGRAVAIYHMDAPNDSVRVYDLTGQPLDFELHDLVPFSHQAFDNNGNVLSSGCLYNPYTTYRGQDLPTGRALYDYVWQNLPEAIRADINADRVTWPK